MTQRLYIDELVNIEAERDAARTRAEAAERQRDDAIGAFKRADRAVEALRSALAAAERDRDDARADVRRLASATGLQDILAQRDEASEEERRVKAMLQAIYVVPESAAIRRAEVAEGERDRLAAENKRLKKLVAKGEAAYAGSGICGEVIGFLEAAGCGKPGTPNTLWAMTQEIVGRAAATEAALREARGREQAVRRIADSLDDGGTPWNGKSVAEALRAALDAATGLEADHADDGTPKPSPAPAAPPLSAENDR
jgi:hypothetical protein